MWALAIFFATLAMTGPATAETVQLYAAGSLKAALTDVSRAYEARTGTRVEAKYGPSGLLKDEIAGGAKADVFASANMGHPQALHDEKKSGPVVRFARNSICALVRPGLTVESTTLLGRMLDGNVKLGTSTPKADPSGDYAFEVFRRAEAIKPAAQAARRHPLEKRSMAGMFRKAGPISSLLIAPMHSQHRSKILASKSLPCRTISPWEWTTALL